jgi:hypothetical protein
MNARVVWDGWFSVELPDGWEYKDENDTITVYDPDGVGALTISAARRHRAALPDAREAADLALKFARQQGWDIKPDEVESLSLGGGPAAKIAHRDASDYWEVWQALDQNRLVTLSYVCNAADAPVEAEARKSIITSFKWDN